MPTQAATIIKQNLRKKINQLIIRKNTENNTVEVQNTAFSSRLLQKRKEIKKRKRQCQKEKLLGK